MGVELAGELLLQGGDLCVAAAKHDHQRGHHLTVGGLDRLGRGQLRRRQPIMNGHHPRLQVAASTCADQRRSDRCSREPPALLRGRRQRQHGQGLGLSELGAEGGQRPRVELSQGAAQGVDVPLASPDQALMGPGQHLDRLGQRAVTGHRPVVVAVGADQIRKHLRIAPIRLGPGTAMPATVAADGMGVDRIDLVAGGHQRSDQQTPVGLDADHHLPWVLCMGGHQLMQLAHPNQAIRDPASCQNAAILVEQAQVMVGLAPVHPEKQHDCPPLPRPPCR